MHKSNIWKNKKNGIGNHKSNKQGQGDEHTVTLGLFSLEIP